MFVIPNPWDVGSARILASMGFKALATTSSGMAYSRGLPDGAVDRDEVLRHCRQMVEATELPVSADLEKGFGDSPESVATTISAAAEVGLAGCSIEDHTGDLDLPIYDRSLAIERVQAACEARDALDSDFVLTARCENFLWNRTDLDDVIDRLQAFEACGADVLYAPGLRTLDAVRQVCSQTKTPVNVLAGLPGTSFTISNLQEVGVKRISVGGLLSRLAYTTVFDVGTQMLNDGTFDFSSTVVSNATLSELYGQWLKP